MTRVESSVAINVVPERVAQYLWNAGNLPNFLPFSDVEILEAGEDATRLRHKLTAMGRTMDYVCLLTKVRENREYTFKGENGMNVEGTFLLTPTDTGTEVTCAMEYDPPYGLFGKLLDKVMIEREMRRVYSEGLQKLKAILEEG